MSSPILVQGAPCKTLQQDRRATHALTICCTSAWWPPAETVRCKHAFPESSWAPMSSRQLTAESTRIRKKTRYAGFAEHLGKVNLSIASCPFLDLLRKSVLALP